MVATKLENAAGLGPGPARTSWIFAHFIKEYLFGADLIRYRRRPTASGRLSTSSSSSFFFVNFFFLCCYTFFMFFFRFPLNFCSGVIFWFIFIYLTLRLNSSRLVSFASEASHSSERTPRPVDNYSSRIMKKKRIVCESGRFFTLVLLFFCFV